MGWLFFVYKFTCMKLFYFRDKGVLLEYAHEVKTDEEVDFLCGGVKRVCHDFERDKYLCGGHIC